MTQRKKRGAPSATAAEEQERSVLQKLLKTLATWAAAQDSEHALSPVKVSEAAGSTASKETLNLQAWLSTAPTAYSSLAEFHTDFDSFFRRVFSTVPSPTDPVHALAKDLYSKSTRILQQCYGVLRKEGHENAIGEELVFVEGDGEDMGRGIKKTRQRGALVSEMEKMNYRQKYALIQKGVDGAFYFSTALMKHIDDASLDTQAARVKIEPTLSLPLEKVPRLGQVAYAAVPRRHQSFQNVPTKVRLTAGDFPYYGPFHSFAPVFDSERASLSRPESLAIRIPGRRVFLDEAPTDPSVPDVPQVYKGEWAPHPTIVGPPSKEEMKRWEALSSDKDLSALENTKWEKEDLDIGALVKSLASSTSPPENSKAEGDDNHPAPGTLAHRALLQRNLFLLKKLEEYQETRFKTPGQAAIVSENELDIARALQLNLAKLAGSSRPGSLASTESLDRAMSCLKRTEKAYRGSMALQTPFAIPCSTSGPGQIPFGAGVHPAPIEAFVGRSQ